jgi:hypothetical protein
VQLVSVNPVFLNFFLPVAPFEFDLCVSPSPRPFADAVTYEKSLIVYTVNLRIGCVYIYFFHGLSPLVGISRRLLEASRLHSDTPNSVGLLWTSGQPDAETYLYLTIHNTHKRQISIPPAGFEPAIPAIELRPSHTLDGAATWIGGLYIGIYLY